MVTERKAFIIVNPKLMGDVEVNSTLRRFLETTVNNYTININIAFMIWKNIILNKYKPQFFGFIKNCQNSRILQNETKQMKY